MATPSSIARAHSVHPVERRPTVWCAERNVTAFWRLSMENMRVKMQGWYWMANGAKSPFTEACARRFSRSKRDSHPATHLVVGLAPDGGRLPPGARKELLAALELGLHVDSGLHDFLSEDREMQSMAENMGVRIRDVRKPPDRKRLHFFSGKIAEVSCLKVAGPGKRFRHWKTDHRVDSARCPTVRRICNGTHWNRADRLDAGGSIRHYLGFTHQRFCFR